jgi:hypothetical protein
MIRLSARELTRAYGNRTVVRKGDPELVAALTSSPSQKRGIPPQMG